MKVLKTQPTTIGAALAAVYALAVMVWRLASGESDAMFDPDVVISGMFAIYELVTWRLVTPLTRPRDKQGRELRPAQQPPATQAGA